MRAVLAWALFDFANTFFAVAMLSFYFPLWIVEDLGGKELWFSVALSTSMAVVALLMPFCGAVSDATGERMRFLRWTTYGCVAATLAVSQTSDLRLALVLFGCANICYQLGTIFYDALLWHVAPADRLGESSGIGASFGYLGSIVGLMLLWPFVRASGHRAAIAPSALFFLLFALPSFFLIRGPAGRLRVRVAEMIRMAALRLAVTVRSVRQVDGLWRFLWASFFSSNAMQTVLVFMAVYTRKVLAFTELQIIQFFGVSQVCAVAGSLVFGRLSRSWGAKRTLSCIWLGWLAALGLVALSPSGGILWAAGPLIGFCLGSTWATSRVMIVELSPKEQLAEIFGLAGLFARAASILGPMAWGIIVLDPSRYRVAVLVLMALLGIGVWLLQRVPYSRAPTVETGTA